ncbi:DMT family transporter [Cesiribacter sp. SM1]|uniref:DMT family transporter n=1 Tax=Cesiribacter sp. SM1 TaxID=2861196 RepID=UPI001CD36C8D|nr:DMT family transporter [Cesiribacter sp. SM1]
MSAQPKDYLQLHFIVMLWGFTAILGVLISIPAVEMVFYRTLLAAGGLLLLLKFGRRKVLPGRGPLSGMLLTGILIAAHWILFFAAARVSSVSICLAGMATGTLWTSVLEPLVMKRPFKWYELMLGAVVILGLYVIFRFEFDHALGLSMAVASAFLSSAFTVINSRLTQHHNHFLITFWEMVGACLATALFFPLYVNTLAPGGTLSLGLNWVDVACLLALALVCTVYAYSVSVELQKRLSAFTVNLTVNLEPIYGILLAIFIFKEHKQLTTGFFIGTLIILSAVLIYPVLVRMERKRQLAVRKLQ